MFIVQAHSFAQQARLAITLAWVAGYTNIVALLACGHVTSHVSGTTSDLGRGLASGGWGLAWFSLFLLGTFLVGAVVSGLATEIGRRKGWESIYVMPMALEAALLGAFAVGLELHEQARPGPGPALYAMIGLASAAMGLQNATITRISSGVVRTTHVTGVLTDLGLELAQFVLHLRDAARGTGGVGGAAGAGGKGSARALARRVAADPTSTRLLLLASILGSFALGAGLGTAVFAGAPRVAMVPPVLFLAWIVYQDVVRPIAEIEASELVGGLGDGLDDRLGVFHLRRDATRQGKVHRMPNLLAWAERLPESVEVVILDLGEVTAIDANSALELRAVLRDARAHRRSLIVAGLTHEQVEALRRAGAGEALDPSQVCPDLELAIARGLTLLDARGGPRRGEGRGVPARA